MSRRYKCVGVIDQTGESFLGYSLARSSFNQRSRVRFPVGSQSSVTSFGAGMPHDNYWKSKRGGDVWSVTIQRTQHVVDLCPLMYLYPGYDTCACPSDV